MRFKQIVLRILLLAEMVLFGHMYIFGKNGLRTLQEQKKQLNQLQQSVVELQKEVYVLENEINDWEINDFYKEKIAREQLQMARKGDKLFYRGT